jgi:ApaG protein
MYREITRDIQIDVDCSLVPERTFPEKSYYFFAYQITLKNLGQTPVQLLSRHWTITDGNGHVEEVKGEGVIGEQPKLAPGESYQYTSFSPLPTPTGNMRGTYQMQPLEGEGKMFDVKIPLFFLRDTSKLH